MSFLGGLLGRQVATPIEAIGNVLDKLFTSDEERETLNLAKERLYAKAAEIQVEVNKIEAQHRSVFVAGWRPAIGWVCAFALAWHFVIYDIFAWASLNYSMAPPPILAGTSELISIVVALLGIAGLRTIEKSKGVSK